MATRYQALLALSEQRSARLFENSRECQAVVAALMEDYASYLSAPPESLIYVRVGLSGEFLDDIGSVENTQPHLTFREDDFWAFGFKHILNRPPTYSRNFTHLLEIQKINSSTYLLRSRGDLRFEFRFDPWDSSSVMEVCETLHTAFRDWIDCNLTVERPLRQFGFSR